MNTKNEWPEELYDRIVHLLLEELPGRIELLRNNVADGDVDELARISHKLRGSGAVLGLQSVTDLAGSVEWHVRDGNRERAIDEAVRLADKLEQVHREMNDIE